MNHALAYDDDGHRVPVVDFDYDAVDRVREPEPAGADQMANLLMWLARPKALRYFGRTFGLKLLALSWVINPAAHSGKSLSRLAREHHVSPQLLSRYAAQASRVFQVRNRSQRTHGTRWRQRLHPPG